MVLWGMLPIDILSTIKIKLLQVCSSSAHVVLPRHAQLLMVNSQVSRLEDVVGDVQSWWQAQQQGRPSAQRALRSGGGAKGTWEPFQLLKVLSYGG